MTQPSSNPQETNLAQLPFSAEEWEQTPAAIQEFVVSLLVRIQTLEAEVAGQSEQLKMIVSINQLRQFFPTAFQ